MSDNDKYSSGTKGMEELINSVAQIFTALSLAMERSWKEPYKGENWRVIENKIQEISGHESIIFYSKSFALVQSSGMGKSKMIHEYSKFHFVIPFSLGNDLESGLNFIASESSSSHLFLFQVFLDRTVTLGTSSLIPPQKWIP